MLYVMFKSKIYEITKFIKIISFFSYRNALDGYIKETITYSEDTITYHVSKNVKRSIV